MAYDRSTIRPGLLVSMKTSITGNMKYSSNTLDDKVTKDGVHLTKWETTRTVYDPAEYERAVKVRSKVRGFITSACIDSPFGYLCPDNRVDELEEAVKNAREAATAFNETAKFTCIRFNLIAGRIASDDAEALRAINGEVSDLMQAMERGIEKLDAEAVRNAAYKARSIGQMLTPQAQERVKEAINMARAVARKITKAGETAGLEIDHQAIAAIASRRTAFLDLDEAGEIAAPVPAAGRAVDLEPGFDPELGFDPRDPLASDGKEPLDKIRAYTGAEVIAAAKGGKLKRLRIRLKPAQIEL